MNPPGDLLLDTSIVIEHFRGDAQITANLEAADSVSVPSVVVGELYYGALRSAHFEKRRQQLAVFLRHLNVLSIDRETAFQYAEIRFVLARTGTPIPENDIWIAALAIQHQLQLATRDQHFQKIARLRILNW
jgi:tRNA(fMet)-specific endonuclease VapC